MLGSVTRDTTDELGGALTPLWPSVEAFCSELAAAAADQVDDVAEAMLAEIRLKIDDYAGLSDAELACVLDGLRATEALFLAIVREGREVSAEEVALLEAVGEQRAAQ